MGAWVVFLLNYKIQKRYGKEYNMEKRPELPIYIELGSCLSESGPPAPNFEIYPRALKNLSFYIKNDLFYIKIIEKS